RTPSAVRLSLPIWSLSIWSLSIWLLSISPSSIRLSSIWLSSIRPLSIAVLSISLSTYRSFRSSHSIVRHASRGRAGAREGRSHVRRHVHRPIGVEAAQSAGRSREGRLPHHVLV